MKVVEKDRVVAGDRRRRNYAERCQRKAEKQPVSVEDSD